MKKLFTATLFALFIAPASAFAQATHTELKPPLATESPGKIEVLEFFWYGCIHCYNLEPVLEPWVKKLPPDVQFRRVPAIFNERWGLDAAIYYTFEAMGLVDKLHRPLFDAIHRDKLRTDDQAAMAKWLQEQGVDPKKFNEALKSFGVQSKARRALQLTSAYKIDGTPQMAVNGRYTVSTEQGRTFEGMLKNVSSLIEVARKNK